MKGHYTRHGYGLPLLERFMLHVEKQENGCWNWTASLKTVNKVGGYGQFKFRGIMERAHRVSWILHRGEIPDGMCILHKCIGNGLCVNPDHLYVGTKAQNNDDRKKQGRNGDHKGDLNGRAKVTKEMVVEMRSLMIDTSERRVPNRFYDDIAARYGVSVSTAKQIMNGYTWKHIPLDCSGNCSNG